MREPRLPGAAERPPVSLDGIDEEGLLSVLGPLAGRRVGLVGGVGDVAVSLLAEGASVLHLVDARLRPLAEARRAALRALPVQSTRSYLGFGHFGRRVWFAHYLRPHLPPDVARWWGVHEPLVREGLEGIGAWERAWRGTARWFRVSGPLRRAARATATLQVGAALRGEASLDTLRTLGRRVESLLEAPSGGLARRLVGQAGPEDVPAWLEPARYARAQARVDAWTCVEGESQLADVWSESPALDAIVELHAQAPAGWRAPVRVRYGWAGEELLADGSVGALYRSVHRRG